MGSCDDDRSQAPSIPEGDPTMLPSDEEEGTVDPREEQRNLWAQTEGYTPLADVQYTSLMVSMGPSDGEDSSNDDEHSQDILGWRESGGAFFVNPSAFSTNGEDENENEINGVEDGVTRINNTCDVQTSSIDDYETIAGKALSLLDEEYERTINVERITPDTPTILPTSNAEDISQTTPQGQQDDIPINDAKSYDHNNKISVKDGFVADWNHLERNTSQTTAMPSQSSKDMVHVDTEAVRKVVHGLSLQANNPFQRKFNEWEQRHPALPSTHSLIPLTPYKAFRRTTDKAKQATASLSRSATLAEALCRLREKGVLPLDATTLIIDVVGVDHVECESIERIQATFRPIVRWIGIWKGCSYQHVIFRLIGRDLAVSNEPRVDLMTPKAATIFQSAFATCHSGVYHEWLAGLQDGTAVMPPPHIAVAYNSGIWGYNEWQPTIQYLCEHCEASVPFVSTAYTLEECQEDFDVIEAAVKGKGESELLWEAQANPFGSKMIRETKSRSTEYRENAAWQAWLLGGKANVT